MAARSYAAPSQFNYGEIPFDKPMDAVFELAKGAEIIQKESASIESLRYYQGFLEKHFNNGFYTALGQGAELLPQITKVYRITYKGWDLISWIDLSFTKHYKSNPCVRLVLHQLICFYKI